MCPSVNDQVTHCGPSNSEYMHLMMGGGHKSFVNDRIYVHWPESVEFWVANKVTKSDD